MHVEIYVKTTETENTGKSSHYQGEAKITVLQSEPTLVGNFTFSLSDPATDKQQLIVRRGDKILLNCKGEIKKTSPANFSSLTQVMLYVLLLPGLSNTLQQIYAERAHSQPAVEELAKGWGKLGMPFHIIAEKTYLSEVVEPEKQSCVVELCE